MEQLERVDSTTLGNVMISELARLYSISTPDSVIVPVSQKQTDGNYASKSLPLNVLMTKIQEGLNENAELNVIKIPYALTSLTDESTSDQIAAAGFGDIALWQDTFSKIQTGNAVAFLCDSQNTIPVELQMTAANSFRVRYTADKKYEYRYISCTIANDAVSGLTVTSETVDIAGGGGGAGNADVLFLTDLHYADTAEKILAVFGATNAMSLIAKLQAISDNKKLIYSIHEGYNGTAFTKSYTAIVPVSITMSTYLGTTSVVMSMLSAENSTADNWQGVPHLHTIVFNAVKSSGKVAIVSNTVIEINSIPTIKYIKPIDLYQGFYSLTVNNLLSNLNRSIIISPFYDLQITGIDENACQYKWGNLTMLAFFENKSIAVVTAAASDDSQDPVLPLLFSSNNSAEIDDTTVADLTEFLNNGTSFQMLYVHSEKKVFVYAQSKLYAKWSDSLFYFNNGFYNTPANDSLRTDASFRVYYDNFVSGHTSGEILTGAQIKALTV